LKLKERNDNDKRNQVRSRSWLNILVVVYVVILTVCEFNLFWGVTGILAIYFIYGLIGIIHYYKGKTLKLSKDDVLTIAITIICEIGLVIYLVIQ